MNHAKSKTYADTSEVKDLAIVRINGVAFIDQDNAASKGHRNNETNNDNDELTDQI